jgi:eukaryotic-like serine/threonine-protein kinase
VNPPGIPGLRYVRELASGGFSTVYLYAEHTAHLDREVAVKVLHDNGIDESARRLFTTEANSMAKLGNHPNIVQVLKADITPDGRRYLVMQFYPNPDMGELAAQEPFAVEDVLKIGVQIGSAVQTAHRAGILHRDIKPANILTDEYGEPGLTDFGIAGQLAAIDEDEDVMLSVPWAPPEIIDPDSSAPASPRSDVYSLGATIWHLLAGHSPFEVDGRNSYEELSRRIRTVPPPPTGRDTPASLELLLSTAMAKDPAARPASAEEFAARLRMIQLELGLPQTPMVLNAKRQRAAKSPAPRPEPTRLRPAPAAPTSLRPPPAARGGEPTRLRPAAPTSLRPQWIEETPSRPTREPVPANTRLRAPAPVAEPAKLAESQRRKRIWPIALLGGGAVTLAVVVGALIVSTGPATPPPGPATTAASGPEQDAGVPGQNLPPGRPAITAKRLDAATVRFTWTYSAQLGTDSFRWQSQDGKLSGTATAPTVDLPAPDGTKPCLQVKVIRADGSDAGTDWSPAGCEGQ